MFNIEELERQLERLVDGELPEQERTRLLLMLDEIPDGWKRCACAFLRSQCYQEVLDSGLFGEVTGLLVGASEADEQSDALAFTHAVGDLSDDETFREWVRKQCVSITENPPTAEGVSVVEAAEASSILEPSEISADTTCANVVRGPAVTMVLREGGTVVAREPVSPSNAEALAENFGPSVEDSRSNGARTFRRVQRYAMRNWAFWSGTIAAIAISFMLGSWYMNPRTLLPLSPENVSQLAANLPANQAPGPSLEARYGQSEAVDTASQEAERRGTSNRVLNGDAAAVMRAVMQSRSADSLNGGRVVTETGPAITASTDPQTGTVYYHDVVESSNDSTTWSADNNSSNAGYLTLESDLEFEKYYDYDKGTWNLVAVFDGEQNPERSQNTYILSDASVAMLRAAGYEVVQQREMMIQDDSSRRQDGTFTMSEIPVSRTLIRYVGR